ncbi:MAG: T9SS type A sorting domain-containing protein [Bacteroidota bacterium]
MKIFYSVLLFLFISHLSIYGQLKTPIKNGSNIVSGARLDSIAWLKKHGSRNDKLGRRQGTNFGTPRTPAVDSGFTYLGEWDWGECRAVAIRGRYLYAGNGRLLQTFDISNPAQPHMVNQFLAEGGINDIILNDTLAYLSVGGVEVISISDSVHPAELGFLPLPGAYRMTAKDSIVYIIFDVVQGKIGAVSVSDPHSPVLRSWTYTAGHFPTLIVWVDHYLYVSNIVFVNSDLYDISQPDSFRYLGWAYIGSGAITAVAHDTLLYVGKDYGVIDVFGVSDVTNPVELSYIILDSTLTQQVSSLYLRDSSLYTGMVYPGLVKISVANPAMPKVTSVGIRRDDGFGRYKGYSIAVSESSFIVSSQTGFDVYVENPQDSIYNKSFFPSAGFGPLEITPDRIYVYLSNGSSGLQILNVSKPIGPVRIGAIGLHGAVYSTTLNGTYAYSAGIGVSALDISNLANPIELSYLPIAGGCYDIAYENGRAYVILDSGFAVIDVSNPVAIKLLGSYAPDIPFDQIAAKNGFVYLAGGDSGLIIYDARMPDSVKKVAQIAYPTYGIFINDTLLMAGDQGQLLIYNIKDPVNIVQIGQLLTPCNHSAIFGDPVRPTLYLTCSEISAIDYSNVAIPAFIAFRQGNFSDMTAAYAGRVYTYDVNYGLSIFQNDNVTSIGSPRLTLPTLFNLKQNYPNPTNPSTRIQFDIPYKSRITLKLFDVLGREVRTLFEGTRQAGSYDTEVDLNSLASGVYFYTLVATPEDGAVQPYSKTKKLLVIK